MRARPNWCFGGYVGGRSHGFRSTHYATCPTCGKRVNQTKSGRLRAHVAPKTKTPKEA